MGPSAAQRKAIADLEAGGSSVYDVAPPSAGLGGRRQDIALVEVPLSELKTPRRVPELDVIAAVLSLGGDAVACAAAGTFAGAYFGKEGLPTAALARIPASYSIGDMANRFAELNAP